MYPPFAYLFEAAAGIRNQKILKADEYVNSSLSVQYKQNEEDAVPQRKRVTIEPIGAVILHPSG